MIFILIILIVSVYLTLVLTSDWFEIKFDQFYIKRDINYALNYAISGEHKKKLFNLCQECTCKDPAYAVLFAKLVPEANLKYCLRAVKGTKYENDVNILIMNKACE